MSVETNIFNVEYQEKSSWQKLQEVSRSWWEQKRAEGKTTGFGHPDELAEHIVFEIRNFFKKSFGEDDLGIMEMDRAIVRSDYSEVVDRGEDRYRKDFLPNNPEANPSIVLHVLGQIKGRAQA